jgi:ElaB/YqjD/DUF883 family membrane-anchored ribosome-binding protein
MSNVWKGLAVGAAIGAVIGILLDAINGTKNVVASGFDSTKAAVSDHGPEAVAAAKGFAHQVADRVREADLPAKAKDLATDAGGHAAELAEKVSEKAHDNLSHLRDR